MKGGIIIGGIPNYWPPIIIGIIGFWP